VVIVLFTILLIACNRPSQTIVIELSSNTNVVVTGTVTSDGVTNVFEYFAPTNITISGRDMAVQLVLKERVGSCDVKWHPQVWEKLPQGAIEKYPGATLTDQKPFYHIGRKGSKWFSGSSEDEKVPWRDKN
jgi:hypothetical protein